MAGQGAAQDPFKEQVRALVFASSEEHRIAMTCSLRDSPDFNRALANWELRFGASLTVLQQKGGFTENDILDLRSEYGPAAIFPSALYSRAELKPFCDQHQDTYRLFLDKKMIPLHARIKRLIRERDRN